MKCIILDDITILGWNIALVNKSVTNLLTLCCVKPIARWTIKIRSLSLRCLMNPGGRVYIKEVLIYVNLSPRRYRGDSQVSERSGLASNSVTSRHSSNPC